ncbi:MAG: FAD-dependent oxidoreductase, partial [Patescibacteria group bacterium]
MIYDVIVIGGGPAGIAAVVYAARKRLKTLLITESFGGQSIVAADIQNWIGDIHISGYDLAKKLEAHVRSFSDVVSIADGDRAVSVEVTGCKVGGRVCDFEVKTAKGKTYTGKSLIIASGARRRKMGVPGEAEFEGKGVSYCSTCDAPLFKGKDVAVVGGGNAGLETVLDLVPYAKKMYLLERGNALKGDSVTQEKVEAQKNIKVIFNAEVLRVEGEKFIT